MKSNRIAWVLSELNERSQVVRRSSYLSLEDANMVAESIVRNYKWRGYSKSFRVDIYPVPWRFVVS